MQHFADQFKISSTSQGMLRYLKGTIISTPFVSPSLFVWPVVFVLKLDESLALAPVKSTILPSLFAAGIFLQYCHKLPDVFE